MRKNQYSVPKAVYYQCIWLLKDIDRLRKRKGKMETQLHKKSADKDTRGVPAEHSGLHKLQCPLRRHGPRKHLAKMAAGFNLGIGKKPVFDMTLQCYNITNNI